jgi:hypothetical protein
MRVVRRLPRLNKTELRWRTIPYGKWTCVDGREVLFNRRYVPIWQRRPGGRAEPADPTEWVPWVEQEWFADKVVRAAQKRQLKSHQIMEEWGVTPPTHRAVLEKLAKHVRRA